MTRSEQQDRRTEHCDDALTGDHPERDQRRVTAEDFYFGNRFVILSRYKDHHPDRKRRLIVNPPLDYPIENDTRPSPAAQTEVTLAMLLDRHASELPVTNEMLEQACRRIDAAHDLMTHSQ